MYPERLMPSTLSRDGMGDGSKLQLSEFEMSVVEGFLEAETAEVKTKAVSARGCM